MTNSSESLTAIAKTVHGGQTVRLSASRLSLLVKLVLLRSQVALQLPFDVLSSGKKLRINRLLSSSKFF